VSSTSARGPSLRFGLAVVAVALAAATWAGYTTGKRAAAVHEIMYDHPAEAARIAFVRESPCATGRCQTLWIGTTREDARQVAALDAKERCEGLAWAKDGFRVGFVINGYHLRIFDGESGQQVAGVNLFEPTGTPSTRIARGVTFSDNGAAVTFDECPRDHSGCRPGLTAVR
jgi:hypothetical protein